MKKWIIFLVILVLWGFLYSTDYAGWLLSYEQITFPKNGIGNNKFTPVHLVNFLEIGGTDDIIGTFGCLGLGISKNSVETSTIEVIVVDWFSFSMGYPIINSKSTGFGPHIGFSYFTYYFQEGGFGSGGHDSFCAIETGLSFQYKRLMMFGGFVHREGDDLGHNSNFSIKLGYIIKKI